MARVLISDTLINEVSHRIDALQTKEYEAVVKPLHPGKLTEAADELYTKAVTKVWGEHIHLKDIVPAKWLKNVNSVDVSIVMRDEQGRATGKHPCGEVRIERPTAIPPDCGTGYGYVEVKLTDSDLSPATIAALATFADAHKAVKEKYAQLKSQVVAFLRASTSLNDALKRMPNLAMYCDRDRLDKVAEKVQRSAKAAEREEVHVDHELLAAVGVMGKLQGVL